MKQFFHRFFKDTQKEVTVRSDHRKGDLSGLEDIYSSDNPRNNPDLDEFNRSGFSKRIATTIARRKDTKSLVIGIYGKWGSGKTTVINFIEHELKKYDNVIPITFNPWRFPSEPELLIAFYTQLANALGKSLPTVREKLGKLISEYPAVLAGLADKGETLEKIGKLLSDVKLEQLRDRLGKFLVEENKLIVIFMDDIDRLDKDEIHHVFRLVKLSANFENLIYVLAFDRDVVVDALNERYYSKRENTGQNFLEKIVQVPINLPKIQKTDIRRFCFQQVDNALKLSEIQISDNDAQEFTRGFIEGIEIRLETPRMAIRYANMLNFSLPLVKGEVHISEFLLIEAIRAFYPSVYEIIKDNQDAFTAVNLSVMNAYSSDTEEIKKTVETVFSSLNDDEKSNLKHLMVILFPRLKSIFENTTYGSEWDRVWAKEKRIASSKYFDRYFTYSIPTGDVSDILIEDFIESLKDIEPNELIESLKQKINEQNAEAFIAKMHQKMEKILPAGKIKLINCLSLIGNTFPNPKNFFSFSTPFSRAALFIARLIESLPENVNKLDLAIQAVGFAEPISFALDIVRWLRTRKAEAEEDFFSPTDLEKISNALANRTEALATQDIGFFDKYPDHALGLISTWKKFGAKKRLEHYLQNYLNSDLQNVHKLLSYAVPTAYSENGAHKANFEREQYNSLQSLVNLDMVYEILKKVYEDKLDSEEYPYDYGESVDLKLARQFAWIHKKVIEESENTKKENPPDEPEK